MRSFFHTCKHLIGAALLLGVPACDWIHDDSLPPCEFRLHYVYDYNMKFADAFRHEVNQVSLFICDQDGNFLSQRLIEGAELKTNDIRLDLEPGTYQLLSWADCERTRTHGPNSLPGNPPARHTRARPPRRRRHATP